MSKKAKLLTLWFNHLKTKDEQDRFQEAVWNNYNNVVVKRLYSIIEKNIEELDRKSSSHEAYTNTAWPYLQAHINGEKEAYKKLLDLLEFTQTPT